MSNEMTPQQNGDKEKGSGQGSDNTVLFSVLAYLSLLWLVGLLADKENPVVKFHVNQGIILFIAEIILGVVTSILALIPVVRLFVWVLNLIPLALAIIGILNAVNKKQQPLPVIGTLFTVIK